MKILYLVIAIVSALWIILPAGTQAAGSMTDNKPGARVELADMILVLQGELVKVEGPAYVVKDSGGKEIRLMVDDHTTLVGNLQPGAKVEAQMTGDGYAVSIRQLKG